MTTATLAYSKVYKKAHSKAGLASLFQINWKIMCILLFLICSLALVFYIYQINILTRGTYLINSYEKKITTISQENKNLEVSFAENGFLEEVLAKTQQLDFQKTTSVKYIQISDSSVAMVKK
jgi:ABC-type transport system involved in cytochrome bd biosynthesis fused ATPase/permease subunit